MTKEEIKEQYSMRDVAAMYGIQANRAGFCQCPFHLGDRTPSLKLYKDNFHCFACEADGDIFKFVQMMDNCTFRQAFEQLGGTYGKPTTKTLIAQYRAKKRQQTRQQQKSIADRKEKEIIRQVDQCRAELKQAPPLSEEYATACKKLQYALYRYSKYFRLDDDV